MPIYTCPECQTKLERNKPVEAGKKLRCPACESVFAVPGKKPAPKKPAPAAPHRFADDDGPINYQLQNEPENQKKMEGEEDAFAPLKDRFVRSKRGPALEYVVKPSNLLLLSGVLTCLMSIAGTFWAVFPMIFKVEQVQAVKKSLYNEPGDKKSKYVELSDDEKRMRFYCIGGFIGFFAWGSVVCAGASKMHEIEKYWLAMTGAVMSFVGPGVPIAIWLTREGLAGDELDMAYIGPAALCYFMPGVPACLWSVSTLRKQAVRDGFAEEKAI